MPPHKTWPPARLFLVTLLGAFAAEALVMTLVEWLEHTRGISPVAEVFLDAGLLALLLTPFLYLSLFRPLRREVLARHEAERDLRRANTELERRVEERTAELEALNRALEEQVEALRRAQARAAFRARLLDAVEQAVVATKPDGRITYWNRYAEVLYGWSEAEAVGRTLEELGLVGPAECHEEGLLPRLRAGESWSGEVEARRRDGTPFPALLICSPVHADDGHLAGLVTVSTDISALKEATRALRESEAKYATLVEKAQAGVFILDAGGRLAYANEALARMLGRPRDGLPGSDAFSFVHPDDLEEARNLFRRRIEGREVPDRVEIRIVAAGGEARWISLANGLTTYRGEPAVLGHAVDITERRRAEEELRRLPARLLEAQEAERARIARELHDGVGQALTAIKFAVENAVRQFQRGTGEASLATLQAISPKVQEAVEEVRRMAMDLRPAVLDDLGLGAALQWLARTVRDTNPGVEIVTRIEPCETPVPPAVATAAFRIAQEALTNALRHAGARTVEIALECGPLTLVVADDGRGFRPGDKGVNGGFGLRSMAERARLSGGELVLDAEPGRGTRVEVRWPGVRAGG
ncbi:PAS domain-containing sensor histidine kinase [Deferrisoma sp.]